MTDNGTSLKSYRHRKVPRMIGIKHKRTRAKPVGGAIAS
jgi:hypothetical protein